MTKPKKRPSKSAKAAQKILSDSKLLNEKNDRQEKAGSEFKQTAPTPRTVAKANKPRPDKKRG
ncbi:MAG: hypothetical protein QUS14_01455 [Pyrinomonadaceae bacterium]|nr:hypothetical protein [Pyrinomonadaceae bacterium]